MMMARLAGKFARTNGDGIQSVADAKAYELEKSKGDADQYMELKRLEIAKAQTEKWDGKFPLYFMGSSSPMSTLLTLPNVPEPAIKVPQPEQPKKAPEPEPAE